MRLRNGIKNTVYVTNEVIKTKITESTINMYEYIRFRNKYDNVDIFC